MKISDQVDMETKSSDAVKDGWCWEGEKCETDIYIARVMGDLKAVMETRNLGG